MRDIPDIATCDETLHRAWKALTGTILPQTARARGWPVVTAQGFERLLLDHVLDAPWDAVIVPPDARQVDAIDLMLALETGQRLADGRASLAALERRSRALRTRATGEGAPRLAESPLPAGPGPASTPRE